MPSCTTCGVSLKGSEKFCGTCGTACVASSHVQVAHSSIINPTGEVHGTAPVESLAKPHNIAIATLLGLVPCLPGAGQFYNRQREKALIFWIIVAVAGVWMHGIANLIIIPLMLVDAYRIAKKIRNGASPTKWEMF